MIKILKEPGSQTTTKWFIGKCKNCNTVVECDNLDFEKIFHGLNFDILAIRCPRCNHIIRQEDMMQE